MPKRGLPFRVALHLVPGVDRQDTVVPAQTGENRRHRGRRDGGVVRLRFAVFFHQHLVRRARHLAGRKCLPGDGAVVRRCGEHQGRHFLLTDSLRGVFTQFRQQFAVALRSLRAVLVFGDSGRFLRAALVRRRFAFREVAGVARFRRRVGAVFGDEQGIFIRGEQRGISLTVLGPGQLFGSSHAHFGVLREDGFRFLSCHNC